MDPRRVLSQAEWLAARKELLAREKKLRASGTPSVQTTESFRVVTVDKEYAFDDPSDHASLRDLFERHPQLIVYHFMFDPSWEEGWKSPLSWSTISPVLYLDIRGFTDSLPSDDVNTIRTQLGRE